MAPVIKQSDDFVIINRSGPDTAGRGIVHVWTLNGPGLEGTGQFFRNHEEVMAEGRRRAEADHVSLWEEAEPHSNRGELIVSFRRAASSGPERQ